MKYLLTKIGIKSLQALCEREPLLAFDFDGTISQIVRERQAAEISKKTKKLLCLLEKNWQIAILSGRELSDLKLKLKPTSALLVGNHGLQRIKSENNYKRFLKICDTWKHQINKFKTKNNLGVLDLEDKKYSLSIHYRNSSDKGLTKMLILKLAEELKPAPRIILGKSVVNFVPVGSPHKGIALLNLMEETGAKSLFYIGDDDTDEDVFNLQIPNLFSVRVGKKKSSNAFFYLKNHSEVNKLLAMLVQFSEPSKTEAIHR